MFVCLKFSLKAYISSCTSERTTKIPINAHKRQERTHFSKTVALTELDALASTISCNAKTLIRRDNVTETTIGVDRLPVQWPLSVRCRPYFGLVPVNPVMFPD